ncbi:MAG: calcium/sodium antiporter [Flavicella sp.]
MDIIYIVVGLILLILGGDWLLKAAVAFSLQLKIPKMVIGMTVVSFATSAPELIVSLKSALSGHPDLALGNVIGSNIANLAMVLGVTILLSTIKVPKSFYKLDWLFMFAASLLFSVFIFLDGTLQSHEGAILFLMLVAYLVYILINRKSLNSEEEDIEVNQTTIQSVGFLMLGGIALWGGSEILINGAISMAESFGVSQRIIGITIVSIGTSIPELSASIVAVIKKEKTISLGNLIGSNVFNILAVLGLTAAITPISVMDIQLISNDIFWMLGVSFAILPLSFLNKRKKEKYLGKLQGAILLLAYVIFITQLVL